jgi:hypothetical protein
LRRGLPVLLLALAGFLAGLDGLWVVLGHFRLDGGAYFGSSLLALVLLAGGCFYRRMRPDPRLAAMLLGTAFLLAFSLAASVLNYLLLTRAGARIDLQLATLDRALGFDWPRVMAWMAQHPLLNQVAMMAYSSMLPQVALLTILLAAREPERVYRFLLAVALSALACIAIWGFAPSFGAFSVYPPPPPMMLALDQAYAHELVRLLHDGPGLMSPRDTKGLIGFPSYHAVLALLVAWHARKLPFLRWPAILLNGAVLLATPVQGGHHLLDVLAGFPVAALALFIAELGARYEEQSGLVNKVRKFMPGPVPQVLFRTGLEQKDGRGRSAIKAKLSGLS